MKIGRKFTFATISVVCISITTVLLKYDGDTYTKLVGAIVAAFLTAQTLIDHKRPL